MQSKLEAICKEVGRIVEKAPPGARLGLWFGLLRGCDRAMADAPSLGKEPKVPIHLFLEFDAKSPIPLLQRSAGHRVAHAACCDPYLLLT